jgi:unsaturated chondroitin disaccharide hydrolase
VLVDTLMNLPLLVWAVEQGADKSLLDVVRNHAATSLRYVQRADGSVYHRYRFDPASGAPIGGDTYQGLGPESSWTRGQAWAIGGLAMLGAKLDDADYVAASERAAEYFLSALPADGIAPWDFHATGENVPRDSSASAIAAFGLLRLHKASGKAHYLAASRTLLQALHRDCANRGEAGGLLLHGTADLPHGLGVDESVMYGDYYYFKALMEHAAL